MARYLEWFVYGAGVAFAAMGLYQVFTGTHSFGSPDTLAIDVGIFSCAIFAYVRNKKKKDA